MSLLRIITGFGGLFALLVAFILSLIFPGEKYPLIALIVSGVLVLLYIILNFKAILSFLMLKSTVFGMNLAVVLAIVLGIIIAVNVISVRHSKSFDTTKNKRYSLSPQTIKIIKNLKNDVIILGVFNPGEMDWRIKSEDLIDQYKHQSTKLKYVYVDPDKNPALVDKYNLPKPVVSPSILVKNGAKIQKVDGFDEEDITNALISVTREKNKTIYFAIGDGEKSTESMQQDGLSGAKEALTKENYSVGKVNLLEWRSVPDDCSALVIPSPSNALWNIELKAITDYIMRGGKVLFMLEPERNSEIVDYLTQFGIKVGNDVVVEPSIESMVSGGDYLVVFAHKYSKASQITKDLPEELRTIFPKARSVSQTKELPKGVSFTELITTSDQSWGETNLDLLKSKGDLKNDNGDLKGPVCLAAIANIDTDKFTPKAIEVEKNIQSLYNTKGTTNTGTNTEETITTPSQTITGTISGNTATTNTATVTGTTVSGNKTTEQTQSNATTPTGGKIARVVVYGDSDFATNGLFGAKAGNGDLFLNTINWMAEEEDLISIRPKDIKDTSMILTTNQLRIIFVISLFTIPLLVIISGIAVWYNRRRLA